MSELQSPCDCPYDGVSESHCPLCHVSDSDENMIGHDCKVSI